MTLDMVKNKLWTSKICIKNFAKICHSTSTNNLTLQSMVNALVAYNVQEKKNNFDVTLKAFPLLYLRYL